MINTFLPSSIIHLFFFKETLCGFRFLFLRQSRQAVMDINTEPSQNEQIVWDDPTAREERARLVSNLQWPNSPSQYSEQIQTDVNNMNDSPFRESFTDREVAELGKEKNTCLSWTVVRVICYDTMAF